ncbi:uncharacterized protein DS421_10g292850 [Arachis hypogaea]|nr:uncharacterized protein DS421_10g292850 [Arachis hypogaea]
MWKWRMYYFWAQVDQEFRSSLPLKRQIPSIYKGSVSKVPKILSLFPHPQTTMPCAFGTYSSHLIGSQCFFHKEIAHAHS